MPCKTESDLPEHQRELVWVDPPIDYLQQHVTFWKQKKKIADKWSEIKELYTFHQNPNNPKALRCCHTCNLEFDTVPWYMVHVDTYEHHVRRCNNAGLPPPQNPLHCKLCDFVGLNKARFRAHTKTFTHCCNLAKSKGEKIPTNEKYCKVCDQEFSSIRAMQVHLKTDKHKHQVLLGEQKSAYNCTICNLCFSSKQALEVHFRGKKHKIQAGEESALPTYCQCCSAECKTRKKYLRHCKGSKHKKNVQSAIK